METEPKRSRGRPRRPEGALPPTTPAERKRASRTRIKQIRDSLGEKGMEIVPLVVHPERIKIVKKLAKEIGKPYQVLLAKLVEKVLLEPLTLYALLSPQERLAYAKNCGATAFEIHWQFCELGGLDATTSGPTE